RPTISSTFSARAGSVERLKVRRRCGCRRLARQMRCTVCSARPTVLAIARPVQWVISPGGSPQVNASTLLTVSIATHFLPGGRVLSRSRPDTPASAYRPRPRHCRTAHTGTAGHLQHRQPFGREQNNAGTLHMLHRPGAITNDRFQADAILVADDDTKILGHTHSMPYSMPMTHLFQSIQ